jgi:hypothetical protein
MLTCNSCGFYVELLMVSLVSLMIVLLPALHLQREKNITCHGDMTASLALSLILFVTT